MNAASQLRTRLRAGGWRLACLGAAAALFGLSLCGLAWPASRGDARYFFAFDISQSMAVSDARWQGRIVSRLEHARALAGTLLDRLPCGSFVGVGIFVERATQALLDPVEICAHRAALDDVLAHLDHRMAWAADSRIHHGVHATLEQLERHLPATALVFFSDGDQAPRIFPGSEPRFAGDRQKTAGVLVAVGGAAPRPVPRFGPDGRLAGYWTPEEAAQFASSGTPILVPTGADARNAAQRAAGSADLHLSRRRNDVLAAIAEDTGLTSVPAEPPERLLEALIALPRQRQDGGRTPLADAFAACGLIALFASLAPRAGRSQSSLRTPAVSFNRRDKLP